MDSQKDNCEMDYDKVAEAITERTKAIVAVDLAGIVADYDKLFEVAASKKNLFKAKEGDSLGARIQQAIGRVIILADGAHSLGACKNGKMAGEIADFTDFCKKQVKTYIFRQSKTSTFITAYISRGLLPGVCISIFS